MKFEVARSSVSNEIILRVIPDMTGDLTKVVKLHHDLLEENKENRMVVYDDHETIHLEVSVTNSPT